MSIEVKNLSFSYGHHQVLHDISFSVNNGELLSILGPNGVGKSTLFRCVLGLLDNYDGTVLIDGVSSAEMSIKERAKHIAYIPQSSAPAFNYSVFDIVLMGATGNVGQFSSPREADRQRACAALEKLGISHLMSKCFHRISGGERQLALIARALVQNARILMLDEPTASLDFGNQLLVLRQARALADEGYTVIQTTHNPEQSYMFSDRIICLKDGRMLLDGTPQQVLSSQTVKELYREEVDVLSLYDDKVRVCIPTSITKTPKDI